MHNMPPNHLPTPQGAREQFASLLQEELKGLGSPTLVQIVEAGRARRSAPLNKSSVSEWRRGKSLPETTELLESLLCALDRISGVRGRVDREVWLRAYAAAQRETPVPSLTHPLTVRDAGALELGVHRAQSLAGMTLVPSYIPRDLDGQVRGALSRLIGEGGMLLLTGDSAVGKTRTAHQAMLDTVPDHVLLAPESSTHLERSIASAIDHASSGIPTLLWLNDAERFLGPQGLGMQEFRTLRSARVVIVATMRDSFRLRLVRERVSVDILNLAEEIHLERIWSPDELARTRKSLETERDPRVAEALRAAREHGVAEYLAAGPQLWRELQEAPRVHGHPRGAALVHAAIDLARAGISSPISLQDLTDLHEEYLPGSNKSLISPESLDEALTWATEPRYGVTRHLLPASGGWHAFDFLVDAQLRREQSPPLPDRTWDAALAIATEDHHHHDVALAAFANDRPDIGDRALVPLAKKGNAVAMRSLGVLHRRADPKQARKWLKRAINAGDVVAMRLLGNQHVFQNEWDKGVKWYRRAAKAGDAESVAYFCEPFIYQQPNPTAPPAPDDEDYEENSEPWAPTPRTLKVLEAALDIACDMTYDEIEEHGGKPMKAGKVNKGWYFMLGYLPSQAWRQTRRWRREFARCYDDLANDIRTGQTPRPTCTGEELALHIALLHASAMTLDEMDFVDELTTGLPESSQDFDWDACKDLLFEDHDVLWLYWPWMSGIEDPANPINEFARVAHLRPDDWFLPFREAHTRDPHRGHRR